MKPGPRYAEALGPVLLALADDELVIGHRHSEWTGWAPHLEEDIAFSSIAQDEIGHAALLFRIYADVFDTDPDVVALGRKPEEFTCAHICEHPNLDWAYTLARHFLYEAAERIRLESFKNSSFEVLADATGKMLAEERYHQMHADAWFRRLTSGPVEGRHAFSAALVQALPEAAGLFEPLAKEAEALEEGIFSTPITGQLESWLNNVSERIEGAGLPLEGLIGEEPELVATSTGEMTLSDQPSPETRLARKNGGWRIDGALPGSGGRTGRHTPEFIDLWEDLTKTYREEPAATW